LRPRLAFWISWEQVTPEVRGVSQRLQNDRLVGTGRRVSVLRDTPRICEI
jgi:hypothetical protein